MAKKNKVISDDEKIVTTMNKYFTNVTKQKISHREQLVNKLDRFKNHDSVQRIKVANFLSKSALDFL